MMLPIPIGTWVDIQEALEDRSVTPTESTQILTNVVNGLIGAMVITFGMMMFNKMLKSNPNPGNNQLQNHSIEELVRGLPFMPTRGRPLPEYVYRQLRSEFVTTIMETPVSDYGGALLDKIAVDTALFLKGGSFTIVERLKESGWSSEDVAYDARIRHRPTGTEWGVEVWAPFDWRNPETYKDGFVVFLPAGRKIAEELVVGRKLVSEARWEIMPEEKWETDTFDLTHEGGGEAGRTIEEFLLT